MATDHKLPKL